MEQEKMKKISPKTVIALALALVLVIGCIGIWNYERRDYIDGNVLNLPYTNLWNENDLLDSPWKNAQFFNGLMFRSLFLADSTFSSVAPDLAESYAILDDGLTYEILLKENVFWSDGECLTMDDVVFSIHAVMKGAEVNGIYTAAFSHIEGAQDYIDGNSPAITGISVQNNTLTLSLTAQYPAMMQVLAQFAILPEHCFDSDDLENILKVDYWKNPVVSGMYKMGEVDPGNTVTLVRNDYYGEDAPQIDEVVLHVDYKFTNLDYYSTNNITEIVNYYSMRYMEEYKIDILFYRYLMFNIEGDDGNTNPAMDDTYLRQAIACAIDRESLLYDIYLDSGSLIDSGVARNNEAYDGFTIEYDVEKAKELLAQSDYDLSRPLRLTYYYTDATSQTFMEEVAEDLEAVGFTVDLIWSDASMLYDGREYDIALKGLSAFDLSEWYIEYTSASSLLSKLFGGDNEFEEPVMQLTHEVDPEEIQLLLQELQQLEHEIMYKIPLFTLGQVLYINEERVSLPSGCTFGNTWYKYDVDFEHWSINKE